MNIPIGQAFAAETAVDATNTAKTVGSGSLDVFATPMMIALMEQAAAGCIAPFLEEGQTSVGTALQIEHTSATPLGQKVTATATVTGVDRRRVDFRVTASDEAGEIGSGTHSRFVVDGERFLAKAKEKGGQ